MIGTRNLPEATANKATISIANTFKFIIIEL